MIDTKDWAEGIAKYLYGYMQMVRTKQRVKQELENNPDDYYKCNSIYNEVARKVEDMRTNIMHTITTIEDHNLI